MADMDFMILRTCKLSKDPRTSKGSAFHMATVDFTPEK
jgi:hypothetical protein